MASDTVTCPSCNTTLRPKTPVPGGTRLKCPKCGTTFVTPSDEEMAPAAAPGLARAATEDAGYADDMEGLDAPGGDRGAPRKPKKKGLPLWAWLVGGGGLLVLLCGGCCVGSFVMAPSMMGLKVGKPSDNVSQANFDRLERGMTEAQVKAVMGEPTASVNIGGVHDSWANGQDQITVSFQNDKAVKIDYITATGTKTK